MEQIIKSIPDLEEFAKNFLDALRAKENGASVVGLSGDLGSGKTAFVKAAAKTLNISEVVLSPTFVIAKFYKIPEHSMWSRLVHIDAYRIEAVSELKPLRLERLIDDPLNLVFIEWPENIGVLFPSDARVLRFQFINEITRIIV